MSGMIQTQKNDIDIKGDINTVFDACLTAANAIGNVLQQNKNMGFISLKTKATWVPPRNPVSLRISIKEKDPGLCNVSFDAQSFDGLVGLGSCGKVIDAFINNLSYNI